jgi:integrase
MATIVQTKPSDSRIRVALIIEGGKIKPVWFEEIGRRSGDRIFIKEICYIWHQLEGVDRIINFAVADLVSKLEARSITPATVNRYLAALKTILRHNKQPWDHIQLKKEPEGRIRVLTDEEETTVVNLLRNTAHSRKRYYYPEVADLVEVLVDTGCRLSEMLKLKYKDINFKNNLISIWVNKGEKPRSMPMTTRVRRILHARNSGSLAKPFRVSIDQAERAWRWTRGMMELQDDAEFVIHALRHTCASRLVNNGVDLYVVKEWLGHSSIQVTEKYAHLSPHKLVHAAEMLEKTS